jgi:hypothetical protein
MYMRYNKTASISKLLSQNFDTVITDLYLNQQMSAKEISEKLFSLTNIKITGRSVQRRLIALNITRSFSEAFNLAIKKGRKNYNHLKKPIKSSELRKGINLKTRYQILQRDMFKCVLCGRTTKDDILVIDHIKPIVKGGANHPDNLRTICRACNHGKMLLDEKYV